MQTDCCLIHHLNLPAPRSSGNHPIVLKSEVVHPSGRFELDPILKDECITHLMHKLTLLQSPVDPRPS